MSALTLADAYIAGWRTCRSTMPGEWIGTPLDPNGLPDDLREAWCSGFNDSISRPQQREPDPVEAGYE